MDELQKVILPGLQKFAEYEGEGDDKAMVVGGVAIRYGARFERWSDEFWSMEAGCFGDLGGADVRMFIEHVWSQGLLGRTKSSTLKLEDSTEALAYRCLLPDSPDGQNAFVSVDRGDLDAASIGFRITKHEWTENGDDTFDFVVKEAELKEISLTTRPVFEAATAETVQTFRREFKRPQRAAPAPPPHITLARKVA